MRIRSIQHWRASDGIGQPASREPSARSSTSIALLSGGVRAFEPLRQRVGQMLWSQPIAAANGHLESQGSPAHGPLCEWGSSFGVTTRQPVLRLGELETRFEARELILRHWAREMSGQRAARGHFQREASLHFSQPNSTQATYTMASFGSPNVSQNQPASSLKQ